MRTFDKRIGFLVSYQTLIPNGGIGQFAKSFVELMTKHGIKVDILTDKAPRGEDSDFITEIHAAGAEIRYPEKSLPYTDHSAIFMYGDSYCYERMINFRNVVIQALETNLYDAFVCNTYETVQVIQNLGLGDCIQTIAYTHLESQIFKDTKNPFLAGVNEMMRKQLELSGITIGTQSIFNKVQFENAVHLPIPLSEKGLLEEHHVPREGVLFIGRWEDGKNPELFLDLIEQTKLPAKIMTSPNGARKFGERLHKLNAMYTIEHSIIGKRKVDFITSARVAFNPSTVESYGLAFMEQMIQLPTVALEGQRWTQNFDSKHFTLCNKKSMAKVVTDLYNQYPNAKAWYDMHPLTIHKARENDIFHKWNTCFNDFEPRKSNVSTAKICGHDTITYHKFVEDLNRKIICIDDIKSVLMNRHRFRVIYTDVDTYLTKDPTFNPSVPKVKDTATGMALFEVVT